MRPKTEDGDRAGDQHLARDDALALLHAGDIGHRLDLVLARPALWREERIQPVSVSARVAVGHDLPAFLVIGGVGDPPPDLVGRKRDFKLRQKLAQVQIPELLLALVVGWGDAIRVLAPSGRIPTQQSPMLYGISQIGGRARVMVEGQAGSRTTCLCFDDPLSWEHRPGPERPAILTADIRHQNVFGITFLCIPATFRF
jgi:hypothetical protein